MAKQKYPALTCSFQIIKRGRGKRMREKAGWQQVTDVQMHVEMKNWHSTTEKIKAL